VADTSNLSKFIDPKKKDYFMNLVLPEAMKELQSYFKIDSTKYLPAFGSKLDICTDDGIITVPEKYRTQSTEADFIIFIGVIDEPGSTLGYASFCVKGTEILI
jgi:hypothetical protein